MSILTVGGRENLNKSHYFTCGLSLSFVSTYTCAEKSQAQYTLQIYFFPQENISKNMSVYKVTIFSVGEK